MLALATALVCFTLYWSSKTIACAVSFFRCCWINSVTEYLRHMLLEKRSWPVDFTSRRLTGMHLGDNRCVNAKRNCRNRLYFSSQQVQQGSGVITEREPSKHVAFTQCCFNVGPASKTMGQHWNSIEWMPVFAGRGHWSSRRTGSVEQ